MNKRDRAAVALVLALVLTFALSAVVVAALPTARASSTGNDAWIYTSRFQTSTPKHITGSIQFTAVKGAKASQDQADVTARFTWNNANYTVHVTCPFPIAGQLFPGHGAVQFMRPVFGTADMGTLGLPETHAHAAVYGRSTITRNGKIIAENQPTIAMVTQAIHSSDHQLLSSPIEDRNEIQLIVPGPLNGQKFVKTFPNGYFYIYWPDAKLTLSGDVKPTPMISTTPSRIGRGPVAPPVGTESPRGTIEISLTDTGIKKTVGTAPSGLYIVTITNNSSRRRGLEMTGADLCCTFYTRFSTIMGPGGRQTFRWYFAPGKVQLRDFLSGRRSKTAYVNVRYGGHSTSIVFQ